MSTAESNRQIAAGTIDGNARKSLLQSADELDAKTKLLKQCLEALEHWHRNYQVELENCDRMLDHCRKTNDDYGCNFHGGRRSGMITHDIALCKLKEALESVRKVLQ